MWTRLTSLPRNYHFLKWATILLGAASIPWGTFIGFQFGVGNYPVAFLALGIEVGLYVVDSFIWWRCYELIERGDHAKTKMD